MKSAEEKYHIVADSELNGSYYVSYGSIGGGCYEFALSKSPYKFYDSLQECIPMKELFKRVIKEDGVWRDDNFIHVDSETFEETGEIINIKIQKSVVTKLTEISYID